MGRENLAISLLEIQLQVGDIQSLERLKLAITFKQKAFVAHSSVQQLLASIWYEGLPGFRRKNVFRQV